MTQIFYDGRNVSDMLKTARASWFLQSGPIETSLSVTGVDPRIYDLRVGERITVSDTESLSWWKRLLRRKPKTETIFVGVITQATVGWDNWGTTHSFEAVSMSDWLLQHTIMPEATDAPSR
jgi:hypothetical protein